MIKFEPCIFCGKDYDIPEPIYSRADYPDYAKIFNDHMNECFMYDLWKRSNRGLMAYKEHLIQQIADNSSNRMDK